MKKRYSAEQIVKMLREADAKVAGHDTICGGLDHSFCICANNLGVEPSTPDGHHVSMHIHIQHRRDAITRSPTPQAAD
jgi:hypothetical protein